MPSHCVGSFWHFKELHCLHLQDQAASCTAWSWSGKHNNASKCWKLRRNIPSCTTWPWRWRHYNASRLLAQWHSTIFQKIWIFKTKWKFHVMQLLLEMKPSRRLWDTCIYDACSEYHHHNQVLTHKKHWDSHWNTEGLAWTSWVMTGETDWGASDYLPFWASQPRQDHCNGTYWCDRGELCNLQNAAKQTHNTALSHKNFPEVLHHIYIHTRKINFVVLATNLRTIQPKITVRAGSLQS